MARKKIMDLLMSYTAILLVFAAVFGVYYFSDYCHCYVIDKSNVFEADYLSQDCLDNNKCVEGILQQLKNIYAERKAHYEKSAGSLGSLVNGLGTCCLLAIVLLYYRKEKNTDPESNDGNSDEFVFYSVKIPLKALVLVLPMLMVYLWLSFGFTLFSSLDSRQVCYVTAVKTESLQYLSNQKTPSYPKVSRNFSGIHNLEDRGMVDGCSNFFYGFYTDTVYRHFFCRSFTVDDIHSSNLVHTKILGATNALKAIAVNHIASHVADMAQKILGRQSNIRIDPQGKEEPDYATIISLFAVFGTLLGVSVGLILALMLTFQKLYSNDTLGARVLTWIVFGIVMLSFVGVVTEKPYMTILCAYICAIASIVLQLYTRRLKKQLESVKLPLRSEDSASAVLARRLISPEERQRTLQ